ncbi:hypothetical protein LTR37_018694 [Vermiconidia calcicola]|uniref:Uncharacterized protein n=1 Tax=Vermiconidia calcicola TaxID=1690605 RepID=A0ACC3MI09_9PEZI|nr:hypothetical protein LTR37_018694 [Vermiconidia calcicola]
MATSKEASRAAKAKQENSSMNGRLTVAMASSATGDTSTFVAAAAVWTTTELLENILLHIDTKTLLLAQRVNHRFNGVIRSSGQLQKKLFFSHATTEEAIKLFSMSSETEIPLFIPTAEERISENIKPFLPLDPRVLNPLLFEAEARDHHVDSVRYGKTRSGELRSGGHHKDQFIEGSWQRMYIAHGPPLVVEVTVKLQKLIRLGNPYHISWHWAFVRASSLVEVQEAARLQVEKERPGYNMDRKQSTYAVFGGAVPRSRDRQGQEIKR